MKIFDKEEKKEEFIKKIFINKNAKGIWYFENESGRHNLAPAALAQLSMSPLIAGADRAILFGCKQKNINPENGIYLYFSENEFIDPDIRLEFNQKLFEGWVYNVFPEKIKTDPNQKIWACNYLQMYYKNPPQKIYLKLEKN